MNDDRDMPEDRDIPEDRGTPAATDGRCGDAAIYLLGLLDERHAKRFLDHAGACAVCRDELGALRPAVDVLPATVPQLAAPAHVKRRLMSVVRSEARTAPADASREGTSWKSSSRDGFSRDGASREGASREGASRKGASLEDASREDASRGRATRRAAGGLWDRLLPRPRSRRPALALTAACLLAGGAAIGALAGSGGAGSGGSATRVISADVTIAGASAALHESAGHDWLTVAGLPQPRAGRVYEVWVKRPGGPPQPTSSLFAPTRAGSATAAVPSDLPHASEVMVTQEPAGGSELPTTAAVIVARVS